MLKKSPNDHKNYHALTLTNGLRVLLVENHDSASAAAALAINVGHFDDPDERQGLAHFLEHMLFLGTKKYPDGSDFQKFLNHYGGNNNAWTGPEHTCYFFDIHHSQLEQALDMFSQFFAAPLLSESFVFQERNNVDAEFKLKLKDDIRRLYDVHKETINPAHPFAKFSVGNLDTLNDRSEESAHQAIVSFYQQHYIASLMTLVVEAPLPLSQLEALVQNYFSTLPSSDKSKEAIEQPLYLPEHLGIKISVKPVKRDQKLIISFALPALDDYYQTKPDFYLSYLIGHEGPGSLLSVLKSQHWAMGLSAGGGINGSNFKDFNISIQLTDEGVQQQDQIIALTFAYLQLIKKSGVTLQFFEEKQAIAKVSFDYMEKSKPLDNVSQLAINMHHYPVEDYIFGDYDMAYFDADCIQQLLSLMTEDNMRIVEINPDVKTNITSFWYQVPYAVNKVDHSQWQQWLTSPVNEQLQLPKKNPFIVMEPHLEAIEKASEVPIKLVADDGITIWHKQDKTYLTPKGYIYLGFDIPASIETAQSVAMTRLFVELFTDKVTEENYAAELAGIHYHLYSHQGGLTLQMSGLSANQHILLDRLLQQLISVNYEQSRFELFKKQLGRQWQNSSKSKSISQLFSKLSCALQPHNFETETLVQALFSIDFEKFNDFVQKLFAQISVEVLIHGNWTQTQARNIAKSIEAFSQQRTSNKFKVQCPVIDASTIRETWLPMTLAEHDYACVVYFPQQLKDTQAIAESMILSHMLAPLFFQSLRTEKQYGYLVGVNYVPVNRYPGLAFYIQSPHIGAIDILNGIDEFIANCHHDIEQMPDEVWSQLKHGLISQLDERDTSLRVKSQRFWMCIANEDYHFDHQQKLIVALEHLNKSDLLQYLNNKIQAHGQHNKIVMLSDKEPISAPEPSKNIKVITKLAEFMQEMTVKF